MVDRSTFRITEGELWNIKDHNALPNIGVAWVAEYDNKRGSASRKKLYKRVLQRFISEKE